jgi:hypothetical protein
MLVRSAIFKQVLDRLVRALALVIGNGINRFDAPPSANSWTAWTA